MNPPSDDIAAFYRRYPYPRVDQVEYDRNLLDHIYYLAHACARNPAPRHGGRRGRMLVAGAGTREAVMWGLSLPHFDVEAIDVSDRSLEIAGHLAAQLGLANVRLCRGDIGRGEGFEGPYDFISSFGVLHHLADPVEGLRRLVSALAPGGVMALMLYNHTNRRPLQEAQRIIHLCAPDTGVEAAALALCHHGAGVPGRLQPVFRAAVEDYDDHRQHFADTMLNPRESSYSVPELVEFLAAAGLEMVSPVQPIAWDPIGAMDEASFRRFIGLPRLERLEIADLLIAPIFWFAVRRRGDAPASRPCLGDEALFWRIVPMPLDTGTWPVDSLRVADEPRPLGVQMRELEGDYVALWRDAKHTRPYHRIAMRMIALVDGRRTLREIAERAARLEGTEFALVSDTLRRFLHAMIDEMALATPDVTRCETCPLRLRTRCT